MTALQASRKIQRVLGFIGEDVDGDIGPKTLARVKLLGDLTRSNPDAAWPATELTGNGTWGWSAYVEGSDIVIRNASVTWFGGLHDPQDNGETASGIMNKQYGVLGCALPVINGHGSTKGSPVAFPRPYPKPGIPWETVARFSAEGRTIVVPLIDNGPAKSAGHEGDLTPKSFADLSGLPWTKARKVGVIRGVEIRILDGVQFIT